MWLPPIVFAIVAVTFLVLRLLPGNPVYLLVGSSASPDSVEAAEKQLGLDKSLVDQFVTYIQNLLHGDLGHSFFTGRPVADDIFARAPATLELLAFTLPLTVLISVALAVAATRGNRWARGAVRALTSISMATPEFWLGLLLVYVFFFRAGLAPAPLGRISPLSTPPTDVTGFYVLDSILARDLGTLREVLAHLALPVATLSFVVIGPITKVAVAALDDVTSSEYLFFARANGLPRRRVIGYSIRGALPPILTITGQQTAYLLSGAALVETVFGWNGFGQYAVQSILQSDFNAVQAVVMLGAIFTVVVYLLVDVVHAVIDPRTAAR